MQQQGWRVALTTLLAMAALSLATASGVRARSPEALSRPEDAIDVVLARAVPVRVPPRRAPPLLRGIHRTLTREDKSPREAPAAMALQQRQTESLASVESAALAAQEAALEALEAQQRRLSAQQVELADEQKRVAATLSHIDFFGRLDDKLRWSVMEHIMAITVHILFMLFCSQIYGMYFTYQFPVLRNQPSLARGDFNFGLFDGFQCDPDWRICVFSCCCLPIRWADTASSLKIRFVRFWPGILIITLCLSLSTVTYGISALLALLIATQCRQRIREAHGIPHGTLETMLLDCLAWAFCSPCATMQEAMEVEFIDPPLVQLLTEPPPDKSYMRTIGRS